MSWRRFVVAGMIALVVAACGNAAPSSSANPGSTLPIASAAAASRPVSPLTPRDPNRISSEQTAAIVALGAASDPTRPPKAAGHAGHDASGPVTETPLVGAEFAAFADQVHLAVAAANELDTVAKAEAAGYVQASAPIAGIGIHWVKWSLIDAPFDPSTPSMLLFDRHDDGTTVLVGFSYWLRSSHEPAGFAGNNDHWHQHTGLCIVNGWVDRELATGPEACAGTYLAGSDLWMLHAWIVPGWTNRWGTFAVRNPTLCPPAAGTPDILRCPAEFTLTP